MSGPGLRRALHAASAAVLLPALHSPAALRVGLVWLAGLAALSEFARFASPRVRRRMEALVPVFRPRETDRVNGAVWLAFGYALAAWLAMPAPVIGVLAGALADPAAALAGTRWGGGGRKSWAGSGVALLVIVVVALAVGARPIAALAAGLVGAALERWSGPIDDNLVLAPGVAVTVALLA
jgi:dolichol kinase